MTFKTALRNVTPAPAYETVHRIKQWLSTPALRKSPSAPVERRGDLASGRISYSAYGEDLIVTSWLLHAKADMANIRYLDIGAGHPTYLSNTFLLYNYGARGVLIEPDPDQASLLRSVRPNDTVINAGIAWRDRRAATSLFRITNRLFNTVSEERAKQVVDASQSWPREQRQAIIDRIDIPLISINDVIREYMVDGLDFASIDVESVDFDVLRSLDLSLIRAEPAIPSFICIEHTVCVFDQTLALLGPAGFTITVSTPDNWVWGRHLPVQASSPT
jgi:FkbM family methyltransferase